MNDVRKAAEAVIRGYERMNELLPLAGGIPRPAEQSDDHSVVLALAYLAEHPADDGELAGTNDLESLGFKFASDGEAMYRYVDVGNSVEVVCGIDTNSRSDMHLFATSLSLHWSYPGPPKVGFAFQIEDDPTLGHVRRLLAALQG